MISRPVSRRFISVGSGQLHLRSAGETSSATPVVMIHMVPKSGRIFTSIMPYLAHDRLVMAPDLPGYGESDPLPAPVTVPDYAATIWEAVDALGLEQVNLIGYHTGSMVAVEAARMRPGSVGRVINVSAPLFTAEEVDEFRTYYAPIPLDEAGTRFRVMWERIMHDRGPGMTLEMAAASLADNLRGGERYEDGHAAAFDYASTYPTAITELRIPLRIINIRDDLYRHTRRVDEYLPAGCERRDFDHWGTGFLDLHPREVAAEFLSFLDGP